jgi:hypothetical protein
MLIWMLHSAVHIVQRKFSGYRQWLQIRLPYGLNQDGSSYIVELVLVLNMYEIFTAQN